MPSLVTTNYVMFWGSPRMRARLFDRARGKLWRWRRWRQHPGTEPIQTGARIIDSVLCACEEEGAPHTDALLDKI